MTRTTENTKPIKVATKTQAILKEIPRGSGCFPKMGDRDDPAAMSTLTTTGMTRRRSLP